MTYPNEHRNGVLETRLEPWVFVFEEPKTAFDRKYYGTSMIAHLTYVGNGKKEHQLFEMVLIFSGPALIAV